MHIDEQIGRNLARSRGSLSQQDLATRMRERGWKWSQATVWSIEKGERPLRLGEAHDVADELRVTLSELLLADGAAQIMAHQRAVQRASDEVSAALERLREAQIQLAMAADMHTEHMSDRWKDIVRDWLSRTGATFDEEARLEDREHEAVEQLRTGMTAEEMWHAQEHSLEGYEFMRFYAQAREARGGERSEAT